MVFWNEVRLFDYVWYVWSIEFNKVIVKYLRIFVIGVWINLKDRRYVCLCN